MDISLIKDFRDRPLCRLFETGMCFRPKCPFRHVNKDGTELKAHNKTINIAEAQAQVFGSLFEVDPKTIERYLLSPWEYLIKKDLSKLKTKSKNNEENFVYVPDWTLEDLYSSATKASIRDNSHVLKDPYIIKVLSILKGKKDTQPENSKNLYPKK
ncbi:MAG: hypothetical protein MHPSP_003455 [Paramarteilia canceri]